MANKITVHVRGGMVQEITDISDETVVRVIDWDVDGVDPESLTEVDGKLALVRLWHVKDVPLKLPEYLKHNKDCECGVCTGEDRALERMEKGICKCERMFEPDWDL